MKNYQYKRNLYYLYKKIRGIIKRNKIIFSLHRRLTDKEYQRQKKQMNNCAKKTKAQIKHEMDIYAKYWKCPADDYIRYGLFNKNLSIDEILDYVPMQFYYCDFYDEMFNNHDIVNSEDKWEEYKLFKKNNIPQPEVIALIENGKLISYAPEMGIASSLTLAQLGNLMNENERLFIKPVDGNCGTGIHVIKKQNGQITTQGKIILDINHLSIKKHLKYIVQRGLIQCSDLSKINESSLNTLRTIVKYVDGKAIIIAILLRIGRKGMEVDNSGQGGISVEVNLKDGSLGEFAGREHGGNIFFQHPDTGFVFKGSKINNWNNVLEQINNIVSRIDGFKTLGWDIAICEDKVYAIEMNLGWGIEHAQTIAGGFRRRMGIYPNNAIL